MNSILDILPLLLMHSSSHSSKNFSLYCKTCSKAILFDSDIEFIFKKKETMNFIGRIIVLVIISGWINDLHSQSKSPPIPVEIFIGNQSIFSQTVVKRKFEPQSKFAYFSLGAYTADYDNELSENSLVMINQISYDIGKGFGIMTGAEINSEAGFSAVVGPQHNFSSENFLAVTILSFFINTDNDVRLFGLYEFKPKIGNKLRLYNRVQFIYNQNLREGLHNRSYLYLRTGLKINSLIFGLAANLDQFGPARVFKENYGLFVRYELK